MADIRQRILIDSVDNTSKGFRSAQKSATSFEATINRLKASLFGFIGINIAGRLVADFARLSDEAIELSAKLKIATNSGEEFAEAYSTLLDLSTQTGTSFEANVTLFSRLKIALAGAGQDAQALALNLTQVLNDGLRISGASAQESAGTIRQFSQAMASGVLRGEEFNSIMENAPRIVQALTDSLGIGVGQLRALSKEGRLSAQVVTDALLEQQAALRAQAAELPITIGRAIENIRTAFTVYLSQYDEGNQKVADFANSVAENFETIADSVVIAGKALTVYFGASALKRLGAYGAAVAAAAKEELAADAKRLATAQAAEAAQIVATRAKLARIAEEIKAQAAQAAEEAKIATARKVIAAQEKLDSARRKAIKAEEAAIAKQYREAEKAAAAEQAVIRQQAVVAEKKAAVEIAVARETLQQKRIAYAKANAIIAEQEKAQRLQERIDAKLALKDQTDKVKADVVALESRKAKIEAALVEGKTSKQVAATLKAEAIANAELSASQQKLVAAKKAAALEDVVAAQNKLKIIELAKAEGISQTEAAARINGTTTAKKASIEIDKQAVVASTAKQRALVAEAKAERDAALAARSGATAEAASTKAKFASADLTGKVGLAEQRLAEQRRIATAATNANTTATGANTAAKGANATATNLAAGAAAKNAAAMTASGAAAGKAGGLFGGLVGVISSAGTKMGALGGFAGKAVGAVTKAGGAMSLAFSGLAGILGKIGSALLGWPGIIAYVAYEILDKFANIPLLFISLQQGVEELGTKFLNLFRSAEAGEKALLDIQKKYSDKVDQLFADQQARREGYEDDADKQAQRAKERNDAKLRDEIEYFKQLDQLNAAQLDYRKEQAAFQDSQAEVRKTQLTEELANIDALAQAEISANARRLEDATSFAAEEEEILRAAEVKKAELTIKGAELELRKSRETTQMLKEGWADQNGAQATAYRERLEVQRDANTKLVEGIRGALAQAAAAERKYLGVALGAAERRKQIGQDFANFQRNILNTQSGAEAEYYELSRTRREANAKIREADRLKENGEFEAASKLYDEAYEDLKNVAEGYKDITDNSEASRGTQELARASLKTTVSEAGAAAKKIGDVQTNIEQTALTAAEAEKQRQEQLIGQLNEYQTQLEVLDTIIAKQRNVEIKVNGQEALASIETIADRLNRLDGKRVTTYVDVVERNVSGNQAGGIIRRATGGDVPAPGAFKRVTTKVPGSGSGDKVPAMLEPGEFVIRKSAVQKLGADYMYQINKGRIPGYKRGGFLGGGRNNQSSEEKQAAGLKRVFEQLQSLLKGPAAALAKFEAGYKRPRFFGGGGARAKKNTYDYLNLKNQSSVASGLLQKLGSLDYTKFTRAQLQRLVNAAGTLIANSKGYKNLGGNRTALKELGRRNASNFAANSAIDEILKAAQGNTFGFNAGGIVPGAGNIDKIRAMLTPGEFVLNKKTVQRLGPNFLNDLNAGKRMQTQSTNISKGRQQAYDQTRRGGGKTMNVNLSIGGVQARGQFEDNASTRKLLTEINRASLAAK